MNNKTKELELISKMDDIEILRYLEESGFTFKFLRYSTTFFYFNGISKWGNLFEAILDLEHCIETQYEVMPTNNSPLFMSSVRVSLLNDYNDTDSSILNEDSE